MNELDALKLAKQAVSQMVGDDLYRAQSAFRGMSDAQMDGHHGQSGRTRRQILREYEEHEEKWMKVMGWLIQMEERAREM